MCSQFPLSCSLVFAAKRSRIPSKQLFWKVRPITQELAKSAAESIPERVADFRANFRSPKILDPPTPLKHPFNSRVFLIFFSSWPSEKPKNHREFARTHLRGIMAFQLTPQQKSVLDWSDTAKPGSLLNLEARAGCGKTSTLMALISHLSETGRGNAFIGAFNKSIAGEIKVKLAEANIDWKTATAGTMHSAGLKAWRKIANKIQIDGNKCPKIWRESVDRCNDAEKKEALAGAERFVLKLTSLAKQRVIDPDDGNAWLEIVNHFGLREELPEDIGIDQGIRGAQWLFEKSKSLCKSIIDFDDMIYAPVAFDAPCWKYDWVLIDEAQDTNPARRMLALKMLAPGGRIILVGDPHQAIYGFTGADSDAMDMMADRFDDVTRLPLNFTFRCPQSIVREANHYVADLEAHPENAEGTVRSIRESEILKEELSKEDVILCRNTAPLVELAFKLIRNGTGCRVEGRDIGQSLIAMTKRWKSATSLSKLEARLETYRSREVAKAMKKGNEQAAQQAEDRCDTLFVLIDSVKSSPDFASSIEGLREYISALFVTTQPGEVPDVLVLSTIHKSKGREWDRVFILGANKYQPSPFAKQEWMQRQEANLSYVAITRSKNELVNIEVPLD
jgi:superfamily I DNA/RNA helicase